MSEKFEQLTPACAGALHGIWRRIKAGHDVKTLGFNKTIRKRLWKSGMIYMRASADPLTPWGGGMDEPHIFLTPRGEAWVVRFNEWVTGRHVRAADEARDEVNDE
jgi:hypothetical protein